MKKPKLKIVLPEYQKIFRILHGVHSFANGGKPPSCQFFNVAGAYILREVYGIKATPLLGKAFIMLDGHAEKILAFADGYGHIKNPTSEYGAFHCWIHTDTHTIDFTAPVYKDYPGSFEVPRLMFQKAHMEMQSSQFELRETGDYYFEWDRELTEKSIYESGTDTRFQDFLNIALEWVRQSKKNIIEEFPIGATGGQFIRLKASAIKLNGSW